MRHFILIFIFGFLLLPDIKGQINQPANKASQSKLYKELNFKDEKVHLVVGSILSGVSVYLSSTNDLKTIGPDEAKSLNPDDINSFDDLALSLSSLSATKASDHLQNLVTLLPLVFLLEERTRNELIPILSMTAKVLIYNTSITHIFKNGIHRARPLVYNTDVEDNRRFRKRNNQSFYSGHVSHTAAISMMTAKVWIDLHPDMSNTSKFIIYTASVSTSTLMSYLRVKGGKHFPTDTIAGLFFGSAIGYIIPALQSKNPTQEVGLKIDMNKVKFSYSF